MLRGVSGNAPKKLTMDRKIHRENDCTSVDPSLSGNGALVNTYYKYTDDNNKTAVLDIHEHGTHVYIHTYTFE